MNDVDFYASLPRKRTAAGAIFLNEEGHMLIVKPTYRTYWLLPGGSLEDEESPRVGCMREVEEELGLTIAIGNMLSVDYMTRKDYKTESLQFTFYGGTLTEQQIEQIRLPEDELSEYRFLPVDETLPLLSPNIARRIGPSLQALKAGTALYLEDGQVPE